MKPILDLENIGKKYLIRHEQNEPYLSLRDSLTNVFKSKNTNEEFWALRDISFQVYEGESIGIIGKNGAGKSTLLKILSKITPPTTGLIKCRGRVASLLEVGTGFHPELTGRENIFMNGSILGMKRFEIQKNFDAIVDFSGVEKFLDTPLKHYSSGMQLRLAFAVAAFLENEILIIDEVLAVGDAEFQKKCMGKMGEVSKSGRTVLFVSHNIAAVKTLCTKGVVLENGHLRFSGSASQSIENYVLSSNNTTDRIVFNDANFIGNENIKINEINISPRNGELLSIFCGLDINVHFFCFLENINIDITFEVVTIEDQIVFHSGCIISSENNSKIGNYAVKLSLPDQLLNSGIYSLNLIFGQNQRIIIFKSDYVLNFEVLNESTGSNSNKLPGIVLPKIESSIIFTND